MTTKSGDILFAELIQELKR